MTMNEIEIRLADIAHLCEVDGADLEALKAEVVSLNEERAQIIADAEKRKAEEIEALNSSAVIKTFEEVRNEERKMINRESVEYRNAFFAVLTGKDTAEQRAIVADSNAGTYGDGIALPVGVENAIWDQVCSEHPILGDIEMLRTGIIMKVPQITPTVPSAKKDSASTSELTYTTAEVVLAGKDFHTFITLTYSEAEMSSGALEQYLKSELSAVLGEAMAKDVFATILTNVGSAAITKSSSNTWFECLKTALAGASLAAHPVVYAPASLYYQLLGETDTVGQPVFRNGLLLNAPFKLDNAAAKVTVVDPKKFVYNVIADIRCDSQKDVKQAHIDIGAYARAQGCMRVTAAAAYIG